MFVIGPIWFVVVVLIVHYVVHHVRAKRFITALQAHEAAVRASQVQSAADIRHDLDAAPSDWVTYSEMVLPIRIHVRGISDQLRRKVMAKHVNETMDEIGPDAVQRLSDEQWALLTSMVVAEAYIVAWDGPRHANGTPIPFTSEITGTGENSADSVAFLHLNPGLVDFLVAQSARILSGVPSHDEQLVDPTADAIDVPIAMVQSERQGQGQEADSLQLRADRSLRLLD